MKCTQNQTSVVSGLLQSIIATLTLYDPGGGGL